jgi:vacuolar-type H+-ATPase subunit C/Vma6
MKLLQRHKDRGYPTEYLLSRIRGRRTYLLRDWNAMLMRSDLFEYLLQSRYGELISEFSMEGVWKRLLKEYRWVYMQMNKSLRNIFQAFFEYTEIKTLTACLRFKTAEGNKTGLNKLLSDSLLSDDIKQSFIRERGIPPLLEEIKKELPFIVGTKESLKNIFLEEGLSGLEQKITQRYLEEMMRTGLHPLLRSFFVFLIDIKNIISLYKNLRWEIRAQPLFIQGGSIPVSQLSRAVHTNLISDISLLTRKISGQNIEEPSPSTLEPTLLAGLTKKTRKMSREHPGIGILLDYLWRCNVEAQNISILLHGRDMERGALKEELIVQ